MNPADETLAVFLAEYNRRARAAYEARMLAEFAARTTRTRLIRAAYEADHQPKPGPVTWSRQASIDRATINGPRWERLELGRTLDVAPVHQPVDWLDMLRSYRFTQEQGPEEAPQ